jgi:hypothetical protein
MTSTIGLTIENGVKNSPPFLAFLHGERAKEILVDFAERIAADVGGDAGHDLEQFDQGGVVNALVGLGEHVLEVVVSCSMASWPH